MHEHYADYVDAQNARNEKTRHTERNRTVENLLKNSKTCPEESIYQIGTMEESVSPETLALVVSKFYEEFERRFGSHIHILDWALHLDEGTPHIHERHVFDCKNRYGVLCSQQEKALEELGFELPDPDKPKGKHNNRKQTFDVVFEAATIHYAVAKIFGPLLFGRGWCGYACWTAMVLDFLPYKQPQKPRKEKLGVLRYVMFALSLVLVTGLLLMKAAHLEQIMFWLFLAGNALYYIAGITLTFAFKDNRAFCKYLCPVTVFLKPMSYFSLLRVHCDESKCVHCGKCLRVCPMNVEVNKESRK